MLHHHGALHSRASTIAKIRLLRAVGHRRRRIGRMPPQLQPDSIRRAYHAALVQHVCAPAERAFARVRVRILTLLILERQEQARAREAARQDAGGDRGKKARELVDEAAQQFVESFRPHEVHAAATKFGKATTDHQRRELDKQVRAALGVSLDSIEKPIRDRVPEFAAVNTALVKSVPDRYFGRLAADVEDAFAGGMHPETLADSFADRYDMSENDARRLARDQIGKLNAEVNQDRQEAMGVEGYVWRGVNDNRERDNHTDLEGQHCSWDAPPEDGGTDEGEPGHPGEGIQCRCYAEPDFAPLVDQLADTD